MYVHGLLSDLSRYQQIGTPGLTKANFVATDGPPGPIMAAIDGPPIIVHAFTEYVPKGNFIHSY